MELGGVMGGFYRISEWVMRLAYVNLLWILFTLAGLILFGAAPATAAMFQVIRKWVMGKEVPVFPTFWKVYRSEFITVNFLWFILVVIGLILFVDYLFFGTLEGFASKLLQFGSISIFLMYLITLMYIFPVFVHYDLKTLQFIKYAFILGITHPLQTLMMAVGGVAVCFVIVNFPGLLPFFSGSVLGFLWMWLAYQAFCQSDTVFKKKSNAFNQNETSV
ncbi:putative membrane protein YesL [Melghirimyces profundicolus]|uniref:Putative membrane protein YesL n=1 Tax=Melghirimyces profundicolus TaxID=1242148 RepID=A0A2T6BZ38_9BACL|nr:YesL family protein [Melghirimyces profundicolus]PTX61331.1 putative membrane protein YesL [Melghirimyces profundicolus]